MNPLITHLDRMTVALNAAAAPLPSRAEPGLARPTVPPRDVAVLLLAGIVIGAGLGITAALVVLG